MVQFNSNFNLPRYGYTNYSNNKNNNFVNTGANVNQPAQSQVQQTKDSEPLEYTTLSKPEEQEEMKKGNIFKKIGKWFKNLFHREKKEKPQITVTGCWWIE